MKTQFDSTAAELNQAGRLKLEVNPGLIQPILHPATVQHRPSRSSDDEQLHMGYAAADSFVAEDVGGLH